MRSNEIDVDQIKRKRKAVKKEGNEMREGGGEGARVWKLRVAWHGVKTVRMDGWI